MGSKRSLNKNDISDLTLFLFSSIDTVRPTSSVNTNVEIHYYHWRNVSEPGRFNEELGNMTDHLISQAVKVEKAGLGKGQIKFTSSITLYAMVQCTQDLSSSCYADCLDTAVSNFHNFCNKEGCRVIYSSL